MAGSSANYHEPYELLSEESKNMHRALVTVMEELEAIDWYQQRAEACSDEDLKKILLHNKNEEIEHAMMSLEWIRRQNPVFSDQARTYLFSKGPITEIEKEVEGGGGSSGISSPGSGGSLGIGSLKKGGR
jgi:ferritin-like protein